MKKTQKNFPLITVIVALGFFILGVLLGSTMIENLHNHHDMREMVNCGKKPEMMEGQARPEAREVEAGPVEILETVEE